ncbi:MAG: DUF4340 domain-containing protein [Phycisphaerales bacterium]|nr:DUF4340 domain-containing protein [Phycisphaerales bacterium]
MNIRLTLIVLVLAVVAGVVAIIKLRNPAPPSTTQPAAGTRLLSPDEFNPDDVTRISVEKGDEHYTFERDGEQWWQTEPVRFEMVTWSIRMLATSAADLTISETIAARDLKGDLTAEKLGLDPAMATVTLDAGDKQFNLYLGRIAAGGKAYARLAPEGEVSIVEDTLHRRVFDSSPREWRVKNLFHGVGADASRITIEQSESGKTTSLVRTAGKWRLTLPIDTPADETAVSRLIGTLGSLQVESFVDDNPADLADFGLDNPWATITVETDKVDSDGKVTTNRESVLLGSPFDLQDAARYAKLADQPPVVKVRANDIRTLTPDPASLASRAVVTLPRQDVRALVIDGQEGRFRLERNLDAWTITHDDGSTAPARTEAVISLLDQLTLPCQGVEIAASGAAVDGSYLGKVAVEGFSSGTVAETTWYRRQKDDAAQLVLADGSGALRWRSMVNVPELVAETFAAGAATGGGETGATNEPEPIK